MKITTPTTPSISVMVNQTLRVLLSFAFSSASSFFFLELRSTLMIAVTAIRPPKIAKARLKSAHEGISDMGCSGTSRPPRVITGPPAPASLSSGTGLSGMNSCLLSVADVDG